MDPLLDDLNEPQREGVTHEKGPLMVLAGAGSGKTRVITRRIARLLRDGVPPWRIVAVTFTNKAAGEMAKRVLELSRAAGAGSTEVRVATFHSTCARMLRRFGPEIGLPRDYTIYDTYDRDSAIKMLMEERAMDLRRVRPAAVGRRISQLKNHGMRPHDMVLGYGEVDDLVQQLYRPYTELLRQQGALDFDDLLLVFDELLSEKPKIAEVLQERTEHLLIDEFQDTNKVQYDIAKRLIAKHRNICVVGDPDQSIYKFRGAELRNVLEFENDFPDAMVVRLEQNYRSVGNVLSAAEAVIANNKLRKPKTLWTEAAAGEPLLFQVFDGPRDESRSIASRARMLIDDGVDADEIAVFYRSHYLSRSIEEGFIDVGVPYRIVGGLSFFERREIKDALAFMRVLINPLDDLSMERIVNVPPRRVGKATVKKLRDLAAEAGMTLFEAVMTPEVRARVGAQARKGLAELADVLASARGRVSESAGEPLDAVLRGVGYRDYIGGIGDPEDSARLENIDELLDDAVQFDDRMAKASAPADGFDEAPARGLSGYLQHVSLLTSEERGEGAERGSSVSLMSVHAAKGLEFDHVFIAGLEDGLFPHQRSIDGGDAELEEERRLMYVALTRARERLYLSSVMARTVQGEIRDQEVSRFFGELPEDVVDRRSEPATRSWLSSTTTWDRTGSRPPRGRGGGGWGAVEEPVGEESQEYGGESPDSAAFDPFAAPAASEAEYALDDSQETTLEVGARVEHTHFGQGVVRGIRGSGSLAKVTVDFDTAGERKLILEHAGLRIVPRQGGLW